MWAQLLLSRHNRIVGCLLSRAGNVGTTNLGADKGPDNCTKEDTFRLDCSRCQRFASNAAANGPDHAARSP
jgi:hypothetical protein